MRKIAARRSDGINSPLNSAMARMPSTPAWESMQILEAKTSTTMYAAPIDHPPSEPPQLSSRQPGLNTGHSEGMKIERGAADPRLPVQHRCRPGLSVAGLGRPARWRSGITRCVWLQPVSYYFGNRRGRCSVTTVVGDKTTTRGVRN